MLPLLDDTILINNSIRVIKDRIQLEISNLNENNESIYNAIIHMRRHYQLCIDNHGG